MLTDGFVSRAGESELAAGLKQFAARPGWRVEMIGVSEANASVWKKVLASQLGDRFELVDEHDATKLLTENRDE